MAAAFARHRVSNAMRAPPPPAAAQRRRRRRRRHGAKSIPVYGPLAGNRGNDDHGHGHGNEDGNSLGRGHGTGPTWTVTARAGDRAELHRKRDSTGH